MQLQIILIRAMQVMVDLVTDLLDRIASEAASILELEGKETLIVEYPHWHKTRIARQQGPSE